MSKITLKQLILSVLVLAVSTLLSLAATEITCRVFFPDWAPRTGRMTKFWKFDPELGWAHNPNQSGRFKSYGFNTFVRINSKGFRGPEIDYPRRPDQKRILFLGDSFVWGFGVDEKDSFIGKLQAHFGNKVELLNLGVSGYSTDQELLLYRKEGRKYKSDIVVLVVASNDIPCNALSQVYVVYAKPHFTLTDGHLALSAEPLNEANPLKRFLVSLATESYLMNQLNRARERMAIDKLNKGDTSTSTTPLESKPPFPRTDAERLTLRLIGQLRDEVVQDGAKFVVVSVDGIYGSKDFTNALDKQQIYNVALDEALSNVDPSVHLPDGLHWNEAGNELVAKRLITALEPLITE